MPVVRTAHSPQGRCKCMHIDQIFRDKHAKGFFRQWTCTYDGSSYAGTLTATKSWS
jgi:hypothetical protein